MKVLVQNLQKWKGLATELIELHQPDVMLAQEINWRSEDITNTTTKNNAAVCNISLTLGYGTAIYGGNSGDLTNVRRINSPHAELLIGGCIYKKTVMADFCSNNNNNDDNDADTAVVIQFVSFHGYNGQPSKSIAKLVDHVVAVLEALNTSDISAAVFAGDFNTWSQAHLDAVRVPLQNAGFRHACSWPYPGRDVPLDHVFVRGCTVDRHYAVVSCKSDHQGAVLELSFL
jgi:exonuclease III